MPDWLAALILGVIEGVTEFLPISSTGHLRLAMHWLPIRSEFLRDELFTVVIQPGAVVAVVMLFWKRLVSMVRNYRKPEERAYLTKLALAFAITVVGGYCLKELGFRLRKNDVLAVALATFVGGVLFLAVEWWLKSRPLHDSISWPTAVAVAIGQLLAAIFPGLSRSGATILMAMVLGVRRPQATEFSFMLGIPTLAAAAAKELMDAYQAPPPYDIDWWLVIFGALVAVVTAFLSVKWLLRFVQSHTFNGFGWYRVVLGGALLLFCR